jgi:hypothetical protein
MRIGAGGVVSLAFLVWGMSAPAAKAGAIYATAAGISDKDGALSAQATFTPGNGTITVTLQNLQSGIHADGQQISQFYFTLGGSLSAPTALTNVAGNEVSIAKNGTVASGPTFVTGSNFHWAFAVSGTGVSLDTLNGVGGKPNHLIIGPANGDGNYSSNASVFQHNPSFAGSATFTLSVPGVTSNSVLDSTNILNVVFGFGTSGNDHFAGQFVGGGPDGHPGPAGAPEPSSLVLLGLGAAGMAGWGWRRRRQASAAQAGHVP